MLGKAYIVAGVGGVGFFAMSVLLLGVWPGRVLEDETKRLSPANPLPLSASEQRGREIYSREGCAYCHTQQIRSVASDEARFGEPTQAWETQFDYPHLWGTRRIGPDLSREAGLHSEDWQFSHLYAPRALVPDSVMPAFPALFDGAPDRPRQQARDMIAYLATLGRARQLVEPPGQNEKAPTLTPSSDHARGEVVYAQNCAGCHGPQGKGDGPAAAGLSPRPANLAEHDYALSQVAAALWNGVTGASMPGWRQLSQPDLAAVAGTVQGFHPTAPQPAPPASDILELGRHVYADHCAQCHGENGAGDGSAAHEIRMLPTNFILERPTLNQSLRALRNGVPGTPMAPWNTKLTEPELSAVALVVRGFYKP